MTSTPKLSQEENDQGFRGTFTLAAAGHYRMEVTTLRATFDLDRLHRERSELHGELLVKWPHAGARTINEVLAASDFNLSSQRSRVERAKYLNHRANTNDEALWIDLVEEFCQRVIVFERQGEPSQSFADLPDTDSDESWDIDGLRLQKQLPGLLFGDGGQGKSILALYCAARVAVHDVRVLYADWEFDGSEHKRRLRQLCGAMIPTLRYARCARSLLLEFDRLSRMIRQEHIDYLVCDSVGFACAGAGPLETADTATAYWGAIRELNVGSLHVAHVTKRSADVAETKRQEAYPFGSIFWANGSRANWFVRGNWAVPDRRLHVGCFPKKRTTGALGPVVGFALKFDARQLLGLETLNVRDDHELSQHLSVSQRIRPLLASGAKTVATIADELGVPINSVVKALSRGKQTSFVEVQLGSDGVKRWGLLRGGRDSEEAD